MKTEFEKHGFEIIIDDGFCSYKYMLNISDKYSIDDIITDICKTFNVKKPKATFIK